MKSIKIIICFLCYILCSGEAHPTTYNVGPSMPYTTIGSVPWSSLVGGDSVKIYWKSTPYYEKVLIGVRGTPSSWLRVIGVPNSNGDLPILDGNNATTGPNMNWRPAWASGQPYDIESHGIISIVANNIGTNDNPAYIEIANLCVRNARSTYTFTGENNVVSNYDGFAAAIHAKNPQHLIIRNCEIANSENGFFNQTGTVQGSTYWWDGLAEDILLSGNYFHDNGAIGDMHMHSIYSQADRVTIEKNRFGPMKTGALGNQIKDRSAGTVIRYNYIEGQMGARFIDLVDDPDSYPTTYNKTYYGHDFIYGNIMMQIYGSANGGGVGAIHWDGDQYNGGRATKADSRLYFYHNTWVIREDDGFYPQTIFSIQDAGDNCPSGALTSKIDARNNIFYSYELSPTSTRAKLTWASCLNTNIYLSKNWVSNGVGMCFWYNDTVCTGSIQNASSSISPANNVIDFVDINNYDAHLLASSTAIGQGDSLPSEITNNPLGLNGTPDLQYVNHNQVVTRSTYGLGSDLGAFQSTMVTSLADLIPDFKSLKVYPNPNNGEFTMRSFYNEKGCEIYNSLGEKLLVIDIIEGINKFNFTNLQRGVYFIKTTQSTCRFAITD